MAGSNSHGANCSKNGWTTRGCRAQLGIDTPVSLRQFNIPASVPLVNGIRLAVVEGKKGWKPVPSRLLDRIHRDPDPSRTVAQPRLGQAGWQVFEISVK